jgi:hypothetical protein
MMSIRRVARVDKTQNPFGCFDRRYAIELLPAMMGIVIALVLALAIPRTPGIRIVISGVLALTLAYSIVFTVAAIRRLDELQQRIHLIAIATSFTVIGVIASLSMCVQVAAPRWTLSGIGLWVIMQIVWMGGVIVLNRRYR